jgi:hypothetical protein
MGASSPRAVQRRHDWLREHEGYSLAQLCGALKVSPGTVRADLRALAGASYDIRGKGLPDPPPYDWRAEPRVNPRANGTDPIIRFWEQFATQNTERNYRNAWACVLDRAGDPEEYRDLAQRIIRQAQHIQTMISDPEYRERMMTTFAGRDDL